MGSGPRCEGCSLEKLGAGFTEVEIGFRYSQTRLLLIGEASGESEARDGLPFRSYAQSGSLLADAMRETNIGRADVAITNIIRCRPPRDFLDGAFYQYSATQQCLTNYLSEVINELKPRVILALGGIAFRALTTPIRGKSGTLDYIRGYALPGAGVAEGIPVLPTYHPAFLRRGASHLTPLLQRDLRRAFLIATGKLIAGQHYILDPLQHGGAYQTLPSVDEAWRWFNEIDPNRSIYADIETPRSRREDEDDRNSFADRDINLVQFTQRRGEGIALPWRDDFIEVARRIFATDCRKVGHNWMGFDLPVLAANDVVVNGEQDDTMLQFHHYHPDLPQNLQAVAQFCGFPFAWKHLADSEPELYGCLDVDATCWADETMPALLKRDGLSDSYERYVRSFWPILRDMSIRGLPISEERRLDLKEVIVEEGLRADAAIKGMVPAEVLAQKQKFGYKNPPILACTGCEFRGRVDHFCPDEGGVLALVPYVDLAEENGLVLREVKIGEEEKCRCTKSKRNACDVCGGSGIIPAGVSEFRWAALTEFNPNSPHQVKKYMRYRKHPIPKHAKRTDSLTGDAAETTEVKELERLFAKTKDPIYPLLIEKRQLTKIDGTYCEGWKPGRDGKIHTTFTLKPAIWQTSSREPNIQNGLKYGKTEFQKRLAKAFTGMTQAEPDHVLVNFDYKSFFAITLAHDFAIPLYNRLAKIDIHSFTTCHFLKLPERIGLVERDDREMKDLFKFLKKDDTFKFTRDFKSKRVILGIQNGMFWRKLYNVHREDFESEGEAKRLWELVMVLFPELPIGQRNVKRRASEDKLLINKFGGIRRFFDVERWDRKQQKMVGGDQAEAAIAYFPSSHAFGHIRDAMHRIRAKGWDEKFGLCNTIHDSLLFHCQKKLMEECIATIKPEMEKPSTVLIYPMSPNGVLVEAEASIGPSLAEMIEFQLEKVFV